MKKRKPLIIKPFVNKNNKQMTIVLPKKELKKHNPKLKFGENIFVRIEAFNEVQQKLDKLKKK